MTREAQDTARQQTVSNGWEDRAAELWASIDSHSEAEFLALVDELVSELPPEHPIGLFERASSLDTTGHSDLAVPLYRSALEIGLTGLRRRRAVIQMSSSIRNLGRPDESVALLRAERDLDPGSLDGPSRALDDAVTATLALALVDTGNEREAAAIALAALAPHLVRYQRSMSNYARLILEPDTEE